jgi:hypothetical protein
MVRGASAWTPARLFANGEAGAFHIADPRYLFQNSDGTGAVSVGDPVGYWEDISGNGHHLKQSISANRPALGQDAGGYYIAPNGSSQTLEYGSQIIGASGARSMAYCGHYNPSPTGTVGMIGVVSSAGYIARITDQHAARTIVGGAGANLFSGLDGQTDDAVVFVMDGANNAITTSVGTVSVATTNVSASVTRLFATSGAANYSSCVCRAVLIINRALSAAEIALFRAWAVSQAGFLPLSNPYAAVEWDGAQVAGLSHAHGTALADYEDMVANGYQCLGFSNYYPSDPSRAYPLTNMTGVTSVPAGVIGAPNAEHHSFTDASGHVSALGSLFASGSSAEESPPDGTGYGGPWRDFISDYAAELVYPNGGGISLNHPHLSFAGTVTAKEMLDYSPLVLGIEIYNHLAEWNYDGKGWALDVWHDILVSGRQCYGFGAPDHAEDSADLPPARQGFNRLLVPASYATMTRTEREQACMEAYRDGRWYVAIAESSPVLTGLEASTDGITVTFAESCDITFAYAMPGDTTYTTTEAVTGTTATYVLQGGEVYVRAVGTGAGADEIALTQAVLFNARPRPL